MSSSKPFYSNPVLLAATSAYLEDWADDGHSIIPVETLIDYGFSGVWLRDLAERHQSNTDDYKWKITVDNQPVNDFMGVWTLDLLEAIASEFGIGKAEREAAAHAVGCVPNPTGRGTTARLYTAAIRAALERHGPEGN